MFLEDFVALMDLLLVSIHQIPPPAHLHLDWVVGFMGVHNLGPPRAKPLLENIADDSPRNVVSVEPVGE